MNINDIRILDTYNINNLPSHSKIRLMIRLLIAYDQTIVKQNYKNVNNQKDV